MKKSLLLMLIGAIGLAVMACKLSGYVQVSPQTTTDAPVVTGALQNSTQSEINPSPDPVIAAKSCLAKTWEINGLRS